MDGAWEEAGECCGVPPRQEPSRPAQPPAHLPCVPQVELGPRPAVERAPPVTEEEWFRHVGPEGRLQQVPALKARIFSGVRCRVGGEAWAGVGEAPLSCPPRSAPRV